MELDVAPTPQALSAFAGIRSSLEYEYRHCSGFPASDPHASDADGQCRQSELAPPPCLTSGISFEIPGSQTADSLAPATSASDFEFTYESSVDGDAEAEVQATDRRGRGGEARAYREKKNWGGPMKKMKPKILSFYQI